MKFSIITPSHNFKYIIDLYVTIESQTYDNWEWILYVNGNAINEINELPDRITKNPKVKIVTDTSGNVAVGYLKNKAFNLGTGDILVEVDHDDLLIPTCLEKLADVYNKHSDVGFVYSDNAKYKMNGDFIPYRSSNGWTYSMFNYNGMELYHMHSFDPDSRSMAFIWYQPDHVRSWRKDVYIEVGGHNVTLPVLDDQDLIIRTYLKTKFYHIPEVLYVYRITGGNTWIQNSSNIQIDTVKMYHKYAYALAERDADLKGLMKIDIGGGLYKKNGYTSIDMFDSDIICDLNNGIPLDDNSVGVVRASHILEHLNDPLKSMSEIHRVLCDGGWAMIDVPSTDGRGAFQDPTHKSYWNQNSFLYYTNIDQALYIRNTTIKFQEFRCETHFPNNWYKEKNIPVVSAYLSAIKSNLKRPHPIKI